MIYNDTRPEGIRGTVYLTVLTLLFGYQFANVFVSNADMIISVRILAASMYSAVIYIYAPDAIEALRRPNEPPGLEGLTTVERDLRMQLNRERMRSDFLILGIWLSFLSQFFQNVYAVLARLAGMPQWFINSEILGPTILMSVVAAALHLTIPGGADGIVPRRNRYSLGAGVAVAIMLTGVTVSARPDVAPYLERARPWIGDWWHTGQAPAALPVHG